MTFYGITLATIRGEPDDPVYYFSFPPECECNKSMWQFYMAINLGVLLGYVPTVLVAVYDSTSLLRESESDAHRAYFGNVAVGFNGRIGPNEVFICDVTNGSLDSFMDVMLDEQAYVWGCPEGWTAERLGNMLGQRMSDEYRQLMTHGFCLQPSPDGLGFVLYTCNELMVKGPGEASTCD